MKHSALKEHERLGISLFLACVIHAVVFFILMLVLSPQSGKPPEYAGPVIIELESLFDNGSPSRPQNEITETKDERERMIPAPADGDAATAREDTRPRPYKNETSSMLEEGSLSKLDELLQNRDVSEGKGSDASGTGPASEESGREAAMASSRWEDNASREPLFRVSPVIPRWVSEQGLRLKVELSVELNADGLVIVKGIKTSSGFVEVDSAIVKAVSRWKYSRVTQAQTVRGTITYFIQPK